MFGSIGGYSSGQVYIKYDETNNDWVNLSASSLSCYRCGYAVYGDYIYVFGMKWYSDNPTNYSRKYDTVNDVWQFIDNEPPVSMDQFFYTFAVVGNYVYCFNTYNRNQAYKYDFVNGTWTAISNPTIITNSLAVASSFSAGTNIYIIDTTNSLRLVKYDTLTDTYTSYFSIPEAFSAYYNTAYHPGTNRLYVFYSKYNSNSDTRYTMAVPVTNKTYNEDNSVILSQGNSSSTTYETELFSNNIISTNYLYELTLCI